MDEHLTTTWLTQDAYDKLAAELEFLKREGREAVSAKITRAREEGDLSENGGYHAAREEQAKQEARILQLRELLRNAKVGETPADDGVVEPGMVVDATVGGNRLTFLVGNREVAGDRPDLQVFSAQSPLGAAIIGHARGEKTSYTAPTGATIEVVIHDATPFEG